MPRNAAPIQRRIAAYHEAAHAVMAFRFGIPIHEIALCRTGPLQGYVRFFPRFQRSDASNAKDQLSDLERAMLERRAEQRIMVLFAGALAEAKLLGTELRVHGCKSDLSKCLAGCYLIAGYRRHMPRTTAAVIPVEEPAEMAHRLRRRTRQILGRTDVWRAVTALAGDIDAWSVLSGDEAADTVQWARRIRNQLRLLLPMPSSTQSQPT